MIAVSNDPHSDIHNRIGNDPCVETRTAGNGRIANLDLKPHGPFRFTENPNDASYVSVREGHRTFPDRCPPNETIRIAVRPDGNLKISIAAN